MNISHLKIGTRLGLAFGLLIVMMLGIALIGVLRLGKVGEINTRLIEDDWVRAEAASVIDTTTRSNARRTMELVIASDAEHQKLADDGFVALVECDPQRSGSPGGRLKPEQAYRTGRLAHLKHHVFAKVFNVPIEANQPCVFVKPGVIEQLEAMVSPATS